MRRSVSAETPCSTCSGQKQQAIAVAAPLCTSLTERV
nr:MAG TPA: PROTEIN G PROTEIN G OF BOVINE [Caudoviricetes sp.]